IEDPMPDLDALTPQKRYLFLRQMLDIHRATSRRDPRIDRLPDPMIPGVSHYARVDVLLITYDDVDYLVQPSRPGEIGRAERDVGEGTHAPALAAHLGCALHNGVARLRYYVTGGHVA
ncbi:MAG: hypothetical protein KGK07_16885, partial [Chloroflexota bacterium]|nr:hypothetical protein [Chloroflexota bacterium]